MTNIDNARAEAERRWPHGEYHDPLMRGAMREKQRAFIAGAEWGAARAETTTGAIARGEALAAGDPDWMNVTRWPRTEAEATTTILRLIAENRNLRTTVDADLEYQRRLEARLAAVEALAKGWADMAAQAMDADTREWLAAASRNVFAVLSAAPTDTSKEN